MKSLMMTKYGDIGTSLEEQEVSIPTVAANQILIKTHSASFNPIDYKILRGDFKAVGKIQFPKGIGRDVSGIVERVYNLFAKKCDRTYPLVPYQRYVQSNHQLLV